jgi:hypothetical protein
MKTVSILLNKAIFVCFLSFFAFSMVSSPTHAQEQSQQARRQFYKLNELIKIIDQAREAGMSDEDLKNLELDDGGRKINILEYMAELERLKALKDKELEDFLSKKFLTINDIFNELIVSEPKVIKKLREKLVSDR